MNISDKRFHMIKPLVSLGLLLIAAAVSQAKDKATDYVNPLLGTATLWDSKDLGFTPTHRAWGAEVFPGCSLPNAMVQLYTFSPADESYIISVPLFDKVAIDFGNKKVCTIVKVNSGRKIANITYDNLKIYGYFVPHHELVKGKKLVITTK